MRFPNGQAQVFGVGRVGELIDLNVDTLNLDLIGLPVVAQGGSFGGSPCG